MSLEALTEISCERRNRAFVRCELQGSLQSSFSLLRTGTWVDYYTRCGNEENSQFRAAGADRMVAGHGRGASAHHLWRGRGQYRLARVARPARLSDSVKPGVLRVPSGRWNKSSADGL